MFFWVLFEKPFAETESQIPRKECRKVGLENPDFISDEIPLYLSGFLSYFAKFQVKDWVSEIPSDSGLILAELR